MGSSTPHLQTVNTNLTPPQASAGTWGSCYFCYFSRLLCTLPPPVLHPLLMFKLNLLSFTNGSSQIDNLPVPFSYRCRCVRTREKMLKITKGPITGLALNIHFFKISPISPFSPVLISLISSPSANAHW